MKNLKPTTLALSALLGLALPAVLAHEAHSIGNNHEKCGRAHLLGVEFQSRHVCPIPTDPIALSDPSSWAPWTHRPVCNAQRYCVFTNAIFRNNRGVSFVTTPERIANASTLLDVLFTTPSVKEPDTPAYTIVPVPGKGNGVLATRPIARNEIIMTDPVIVLSDFDLPQKVPHDDGVKLFDRAMAQLSNPREALDLSKIKGEFWAPASEDVIKTNGFGLPFNDVERVALFPNVSVRLSAF